MSIVTAHNLAKSYGAQDVFAGLSLSVPRGAKIALVGINGSGKTTLLRLVAGLDAPTAGAVQRAKRTRVAYLPQQADFSAGGTLREAMLEVFSALQAQAAKLRRLEVAMADPATRDEALAKYGPALEAFEAAGGYSYEHRIDQVLSGLGFDEQDVQRPVAHLSGGQKTRALLARLLLEEPDLLLMDEPTNHLDLDGIEWLENYLKGWKGAVIVVAHDRAFLDAVVDQVWDLVGGRLEAYRGNYTAYATQRDERLARQASQFERQQEHIARTEEFIRRNIAGQRSRQAQGRKKRLDRLERLDRPPELESMNLVLGDDVARSGDLVLGLKALTVGYTSQAPLFQAQAFELHRGQRVALLGPNGSGKTTLVRTILGQVAPLTGQVKIGANVQVGHFAQGHASLDRRRTVLETILDAAGIGISESRNLLGQYRFSGDEVNKRVGDLSGGEQARVALAVLALQGANFLILDEPTNHLDILSQEVLQEALSDFAGTLLTVTHDRYLIQRLDARIWAIENGRLWEFKQGYGAYHAWLDRRRQEQASREKPVPTAREQAREAHKAAQREMARRAQLQAKREQIIYRLEERLAQLGRELAQASEAQAVDRVRQLGDEYSQVEAALNAELNAWADASS